MRRPFVRSLSFLFFALLLILADDPAFANPAFASPQGVAPAGSVEQVVVTATRIPAPREQVGGTVTVLTRRQIEERGAESVADLLRGVPGVDVVAQGPPGGITRVFLRGGNSNHTLVLIDGVEAHDPSSPDGAFDWSTLDADAVERIEILSGPQGTLYGSAAMGGVVSVTTRRGAGEREGRVTLGSGSFRARRQAASFSPGGEPGLFLGYDERSTDGFSAAPSWLGNTERDGFWERALVARAGRGKSGEPGWNLVARTAESRVDLDDYPSWTSPLSDDPDYQSNKRELFFRGEVRPAAPGGWRPALGISYNRVTRRDENLPDLANPANFASAYRGESGRLEWRNQLPLSPRDTLFFGLEARGEKAEGSFADHGPFPYESSFERRTHSEAAYLQGSFALDEGLFASLGARAERFKGAGTEGTFDLSASWRLPVAGGRLKGSYATGFKAPTLTQLDPSQFGNPDLLPERSRGWEVGAELSPLGPGSLLGVTWFDNRFRDLIAFDFGSSSLGNLARARARGVEGRLSWPLAPRLELAGGYTLSLTRDEDSGNWLLRRPREKAEASLTYRTGGGGSVRIEELWVGRRLDTSGPLPAYRLLNLAARHPLGDSVFATLRLNNLANQRYEEVAGYGTAGRFCQLGLEVEF